MPVRGAVEEGLSLADWSAALGGCGGGGTFEEGAFPLGFVVSRDLHSFLLSDSKDHANTRIPTETLGMLFFESPFLAPFPRFHSSGGNAAATQDQMSISG